MSNSMVIIDQTTLLSFQSEKSAKLRGKNTARNARNKPAHFCANERDLKKCTFQFSIYALLQHIVSQDMVTFCGIDQLEQC